MVLTRLPIQLMQVTDGSQAWAEFYKGVQSTFAENAAAVPAIVVLVGVALLIWADFRIARWLLRGAEHRKKTHKEE